MASKHRCPPLYDLDLQLVSHNVIELIRSAHKNRYSGASTVGQESFLLRAPTCGGHGSKEGWLQIQQTKVLVRDPIRVAELLVQRAPPRRLARPTATATILHRRHSPRSTCLLMTSSTCCHCRRCGPSFFLWASSHYRKRQVV